MLHTYMLKYRQIIQQRDIMILFVSLFGNGIVVVVEVREGIVMAIAAQ
ncbi:MAG: hypothetical protein H0X50_11440 [Nitrosopumilus sp.]|nr:hypothetical protein [Nitrosopumilus sp.]